VDQDDDLVYVQKLIASEFGDDQFVDEDFYLDGPATTTVVNNAPKTTTTTWKNNSIQRTSITKSNWNGQSREVKGSEDWSLSDGGKTLRIVIVSPGNNGEPVTETLIYQKQ
jgi:hypothetical protein